MDLTKYTHATVALTKQVDGHTRTLLIDPGTYTPNTADLLKAADAVLITHEHPDHFDADALRAALDARDELQVYGPPAIATALPAHPDQVHAITAGQTIDAAGFSIVAITGDHATVHPEIPLVDNVGYLVDDTVFHPGDAYLRPEHAVDVLLLPVSGPWISTEAAIDYVRDVKPRKAIAIHDIMLSDMGKTSTAKFLGEESLTATPLAVLEVGESTTLEG